MADQGINRGNTVAANAEVIATYAEIILTRCS